MLSLFGDVALAIGCNYSKYADVVLATLEQASSAQVDKVKLLKYHFIDPDLF